MDLTRTTQTVLQVIQGDGNNSAQDASFGEPIPSYEARSERDEQIKEWGMCVGVAYALVGVDNPFLGLDALADLAGDVAREAFFTLHPELKVTEEKA